MLIHNKFNGYSRDGIRKYYVDGGIGEMALLGELAGGAEAASGLGVLGSLGTEAALGLGGDAALGSGLASTLGGAATGVMPTGLEAASTLAPSAVEPAAQVATRGLTSAMAGNAAPALNYGESAFGGLADTVNPYTTPIANPVPAATPPVANGAAANVMSQQPMLQATQQALSNQGMLQSGLDLGGMNPATMGPASSSGFNPIDWFQGLSKGQQLMTGIGALNTIGMIADRNKYGIPKQTPYKGPLSRFSYNPSTYRPSMYAEGGITSLDGAMTVGRNPMSAPDQYSQDGTGQQDLQYSTSPTQSMAHGGIASLGSYSDGGHLLKGPGDGMSDSIPASIAGKHPARLATDEFVVPADVVSHLGNGSSDAGAKQLYSMMDKVRKARTGRAAQGRQINPSKYLPA